jgi:hypothetical protein
MINFVSTDAKKIQSLARIRRWVMTATSVVLITYVLTVVGFLGWSTWVNYQASRVVKNHDELLGLLTSLGDAEVIARNLGDRAVKIDEYLKVYREASESAAVTIKDQYGVVKWDYDLAALTVVNIAASSPALLKDYQDYMEQNYTKVQTNKVEWTADLGWTLTLALSGRKKN